MIELYVKFDILGMGFAAADRKLSKFDVEIYLVFI